MRKFLLAAIIAIIGSLSGHAAHACNAINPNLSGPPFVDGCALPASVLNRLLPTPATANFYILSGAPVSGSCTLAVPCGTLQYAFSVAIQSYFAAGYGAVFNMEAGTFTGGDGNLACAGTPSGFIRSNSSPTSWYVIGAGSGSTTINSSVGPAVFEAGNGCSIVLEHMTVTNSAGSATFPYIAGNITTYTDMIYGATLLGTLHSERGGVNTIAASVTFAGNAPAAVQAVLGGNITFNEVGIVVTEAGTPVYSTGWADIESGSVLYTLSSKITFSGSATGPRFYIKSGVVETEAGAAAYFPGSAPGTIVGGGTYSPTPALGSISTTGNTGGTIAIGGTYLNTTIEISGGSSASDAGVITFTFPITVTEPNCAPLLVNQGAGGTWVAGATITVTSLTSSGGSLTWINSSTALGNGTNYFISMQCTSGT